MQYVTGETQPIEPSFSKRGDQNVGGIVGTFVLVHGANHGGWCWDRLVDELAELGHRAIAPDLPCDDPDAGHFEYTAAVLAAMDGGGVGADAVVVGHSLGGFTIPLVAVERAVKRLIFLCTAPAITGAVADELRAQMVTDAYAAMPRFLDATGRALFAPRDAWAGFYHDCDDATAAWAVARLRPQNARVLQDPWPLTRWPDVPRSVILTRDDRAVRLSAALAAGRIILDGAEPLLLDGSHSPFLSRPRELARVLHDIEWSEHERLPAVDR
jgi:alpha-beta hydrolase superfamily lysophospholipase